MITYNFKTLPRRFQAALAALADPAGKKFVVALSGGSDSTALLRLMLSLRDRADCRVEAAHLDHGLRGMESDRDREFAENLAGRLGIAFHSEKADCRTVAREFGLSPEEAARQARYDFYGRVLTRTGADWLATGHTADDQAETVLLNLIRGSGSRGLAGIPPVRGRIIRPCLNFWREELRAWLTALGQSWVEDSSNRDLAFWRNRVRRELIPLLERDYNPAMKPALYRSAAILTEEEAVWNRLVSDARPGIGWKRDLGRVRMDRDRLLGLERGLARRVVRAAFEDIAGTTRRLTLHHVEAALVLAETQPSGRIDLPDGLVVQVYRNEFSVGKAAPPPPADFEYPLEPDGQRFIAEIGLQIRSRTEDRAAEMNLSALPPDQAVLDLDRIDLPLTMRLPRPGDRFQPLGLSGTKKLSDFFVDAHTPQADRRRTPLVLDRRGIVWVVGHRPDDRVKIRPDTRRVLRLEAAAPEPNGGSPEDGGFDRDL